HNLIGDGSGSTGFTATGEIVGSSANPINPHLGPLQDDGGPTQTMALLSVSPAIDTGDPNNDPRRRNGGSNGRSPAVAAEAPCPISGLMMPTCLPRRRSWLPSATAALRAIALPASTGRPSPAPPGPAPR